MQFAVTRRQLSTEALLTTGGAAALLGCSSRHVVSLCDRGELRCVFVGTHRRLDRADVMALSARRTMSHAGRMTEDQLLALWLGRAVAAHITRDPDGVLARARVVAERQLRDRRVGNAMTRQWISLLSEGPESVMRALTSVAPLSRELRQNMPFAGVLDEAERLGIIRAFRSANPRGAS